MLESFLLEEARAPDREVQGFRSLTDTLEWQLAEVHWAQVGLRPFAENQVPHLVTSSGRLSQQAAAVLYQSCLAHPPQGALTVLELGAGTGLFARFFLDAFRDLCQAGGRDFYQRLRYLATDRSPRTLQQWEEHGIFTDHGARVARGTCDALSPGVFCPAQGPPEALQGLRAVLCNYLLDTLPARLLRRGAGGVEELQVRTNLCDAETARGYTTLDLPALRALAESADPAARARLVPLLTLLEPEVAYRPLDPADLAALPCAAEALELSAGHERVLLSEGALRCLEQCRALLAPEGFLLVNDYGPVQGDLSQARELAAPLRLGATMALGVSFPLLEAYLGRRGLRAVTPPGDERSSLHARLFLHAADPEVEAAFAAAFGQEAQQRVEVPVNEARQHLGAGRLDEALRCYRAAVDASPRDFLVLGEAAEFAASHLRDPVIGLALAEAALALNPWYGGWMWSVLGECRYALGRIDEAHQAHLRAAQIHPGDPRAHLNLSVTWAHSGQLDEALLAVARGLACDGQGLYRARLLDRQQQLLAHLANRALGEQERHARRNERLRAAL